MAKTATQIVSNPGGVSLGGLTAVGLGLILLYSALYQKGFLNVTKGIVLGGSPSSVPQVSDPLTAGVAAATGPQGPSGATANTSNTGNVNLIVQSMAQHGVTNNAQIAGCLGNIQVESGFNNTAQNLLEAAIGFCSWEGNRRVNLQAFAAARGTTETDPQTQVDFMWHELLGSELVAYTAWRATTSASAAASVWDALYERSAGTTRQERIDAANAWMAKL